MDQDLMSDDDFLAENEKDGQCSEDCFFENWAALRTRLEGGRLELFAAGGGSSPGRGRRVRGRGPRGTDDGRRMTGDGCRGTAKTWNNIDCKTW